MRHTLTGIGLTGLLALVAGSALSQEHSGAPSPLPHLFHVWSDASGESHVEEIRLARNRRAAVPGITMTFSSIPVPAGRAAKFHNAGNRHFAITVLGQIEVEASDGTKAHLHVGDMAFLEDTSGKGHKTLEAGASSVFLRVPDAFDVKAWARGQ